LQNNKLLCHYFIDFFILGGFVLIEVGGNEVVGRERIIGGRTINLF
jgi:hypothetical protein